MFSPLFPQLLRLFIGWILAVYITLSLNTATKYLLFSEISKVSKSGVQWLTAVGTQLPAHSLIFPGIMRYFSASVHHPSHHQHHPVKALWCPYNSTSITQTPITNSSNSHGWNQRSSKRDASQCNLLPQYRLRRPIELQSCLLVMVGCGNRCTVSQYRPQKWKR